MKVLPDKFGQEHDIGLALPANRQEFIKAFRLAEHSEVVLAFQFVAIEHLTFNDNAILNLSQFSFREGVLQTMTNEIPVCGNLMSTSGYLHQPNNRLRH